MPRITVQNVSALVLPIGVVLAGCLLNVVAFRWLIVPNRLLSGGVVGAAMLLNQVLGWPIGLQTTLYNIPIFLLGYRYLGRRFVILSVVGVIGLSVLLDNIWLPVVTNDLLLAAVFGGVLTGIADGLIIRFGGSTGGFDILGVIVSRRFGISTGQVFLAFNGVIIALAAYFNKPELAMYTLIMLFVSTRTIDTMLGTEPRSVALIVSTKHHEIAARLMADLRRGATYLKGSGAYTGTEYNVLLCAVTRYELVELRSIVQQIDPASFTVVLDASDVVGRFDRNSLLTRLFR